MLYVSRLCKDGEIAIVDSDDGEETVVIYEDARKLVRDVGLDIAGITQYPEYRVDVYQFEPLSQAQLKLKVINDVNISVNNGVIQSVSYGRNTVVGTRVRLSDYGSSCGKFIFPALPDYSPTSPTLVAVLDNRISVPVNALQAFFWRGVALDIRELISDKVFKHICLELDKVGFYAEPVGWKSRKLNTVLDFMIDTDVHMDCYRSIIFLNTVDIPSSITSISDVVVYPVEVCAFVAKMYRRDFLDMAIIRQADFRRLTKKFWTEHIRPWFKDKAKYEMLVNGDYDNLRRFFLDDVFSLLVFCNGNTNYINPGIVRKQVGRFKNYIRYFDVTDELRDAYVRLCKNVADIVLQYAQKCGWIRK